jgi:aspartate kinase
MSTVVMKFGGSSVADLDKITAVARKVAQTRERDLDVVVVVSAMGDTTDDLLDMARKVSPEPSRRELDMLLSVGERISMTLLSMAIHEHGHEATSLTGSQCGIITTDSHSNARIIDVRPFRVQDELAKGRIVIVAGYQGTSYRREVTTLGRGGSDTTAVALAAALGATCEIYSDVDGIFSADPRVVLDARQLAQLSYEEMQEMARSGARVLNEQAVEFARNAKIALYARSTHLPQSQGTVVRPDGFDDEAARAERGIPAVAVSHVDNGLFVEGDLSDLPDELADLPVIAANIDSRGHAFFATDDVHDVESLMSRLGEAGLASRIAGAASVVGTGIGGRLRWVAHARAAMNAYEPLAVDVSLSRLTFIVATEHVRDATNILHSEFVAD